MAYPSHPEPQSDGEPLLEPGPVLSSRRGPDAPILGPLPKNGYPAPAPYPPAEGSASSSHPGSAPPSTRRSGEGDREEAPRFRRPDRPVPAPGDTRGTGADDPFAPSSGSSLAMTGGAGARAMAEPLAALAAAFQANAEALRRSQEMQADLGRALQRADRSEVLLQSTGALNDTFKGLTTVQKSLLQQIDASAKEAKSGRWFLPVLVLASMAVVGTGLYLVVHRMQEMERDVVGNGDVATNMRLSFERGLEQGAKDAAASSGPEVEGLTGRVQRLEADLKAAIAERDAKAAALASAQTDQTTLQGEVMQARSDAIRMKAVEEELNRMRAEAAVRDPDAERAKRDLVEERRTTADLRQKLAALGMGKMAAAAPEGDGAAPAPEPASTPDPIATRGLDRARDHMNELLQAGGASRTDYLQFAKIGGAQTKGLTDVMVTRYGPTGRVINFIKARDLRIVADRLNRTVEFVFSEGSIDTNGSSIPFPGGTFTKVVAEGDLVSRWTTSGLTFVTAK